MSEDIYLVFNFAMFCTVIYVNFGEQISKTLNEQVDTDTKQVYDSFKLVKEGLQLQIDLGEKYLKYPSVLDSYNDYQKSIIRFTTSPRKTTKT